LVTVAGFIPIGLNTSNAGEFTYTLFVVIAVSLLVSWIVAVLFTPLLGVTILPARMKGHHESKGRVGQTFARLLLVCMRHRWITVGVTVAAFALALFGMNFVQQQFFPSSDRAELVIDWNLPQNASITETNAQIAQFEREQLQGNPAVDHWSTYVGTGAPRFVLSFDVQTANTWFGQMVVQESAVYYRYAGQTKTIGYADFQHMLAAREAAYLRKMMETLQVVQKVGVANAGVMDMSGPKSSVYMSKETAKGLNLIDKANLVEKKGAPAYLVMGNVDVNQIVHAPLEDADKNIPTEAAKLLSPIIAEVYGEDVQVIHASQVTALLKHLGIDGDNLHCIFEKKFGRKFVTRAGLQALETFIREHPEQAVNVFGSKAAKQRFSITNLREKAADERSNT
jgi:hypothetical protein